MMHYLATNHTMSTLRQPSDDDDGGRTAYAIILTFFPLAFSAMSLPSLAARASIEADGGTEAVMISIPLAASASVMPRQYCTPGRKLPARYNSLKPSKP